MPVLRPPRIDSAARWPYILKMSSGVPAASAEFCSLLAGEIGNGESGDPNQRFSKRAHISPIICRNLCNTRVVPRSLPESGRSRFNHHWQTSNCMDPECASNRMPFSVNRPLLTTPAGDSPPNPTIVQIALPSMTKLFTRGGNRLGLQSSKAGW